MIEDEAICRTIVTHTPDHIVMQDAELRYTFVVNPQLGLTAEEMIGKTDYDILEQDEADTLTRVKRRVLETREPQWLETSIRHLNGKTEYFEGQYIPRIDPDNEVIGIVGYFRNVTERIIERKRRESIQAVRLRLLHAAPLVSLTELLRMTLDEAEALTGSMVGFYHFVDPDQTTLSLQAWSTNTTKHMCKAEGAGLHYPVGMAGVWVDCIHKRRPVIHNDYAALPHRKGLPPGHAPVIREMVVPIFRGDSIVSVLGVGNKPTDYDEHDIDTIATLADLAWDVAEIKRGEEAMKRTETLLREAQRRESIGILSGGIAHDFNNLLGSMMGFVSLAQMNLPENHPAAKNLGRALQAMDKAAELTRQMLAYAGKGKMESRPVDVCVVVRENVNLFTVSLPKHVRLSMRVPAAPIIVEGDPAQIEQIIMNLLINGGEAVGEKLGIVSITLTEAELSAEALVRHAQLTLSPLNAGRYALLEVADNGVGMSAETVAKMFDPFFTTKFTGRGLGLAAVLGIVQGHKGGIAVETAEGGGTTMRVVLPLYVP